MYLTFDGIIFSSVGGSSRQSKSRRRGRGVRLREGSRIREPGNDAETEPLAAENGQKSALLGLSSAFDLVRKVSDKMANKKQGKEMYCAYLPIHTFIVHLSQWIKEIQFVLEIQFQLDLSTTSSLSFL